MTLTFEFTDKLPTNRHLDVDVDRNRITDWQTEHNNNHHEAFY